jgi:nitrogen fixation-related uncharacterized protein
MEATMLVLVMIIGLAAFAAASLIWGVDSREQYPDDHVR